MARSGAGPALRGEPGPEGRRCKPRRSALRGLLERVKRRVPRESRPVPRKSSRGPRPPSPGPARILSCSPPFCSLRPVTSLHDHPCRLAFGTVVVVCRGRQVAFSRKSDASKRGQVSEPGVTSKIPPCATRSSGAAPVTPQNTSATPPGASNRSATRASSSEGRQRPLGRSRHQGTPRWGILPVERP
jgi:hypothetical protein